MNKDITKNLKNELKKIEHQIDLANGEHGDIEKYCIYCGTTEYDGELGLLHDFNCAVARIRRLIHKSDK